MENVRNTQANTASGQSCCAPAAKSGWLSSRNLLIGLVVLGGGVAMFLGWDWLVAAGVATFIVALAPCAVMCALGLCASRMGKKETAPRGAGAAAARSSTSGSRDGGKRRAGRRREGEVGLNPGR